MKNKLIQTVLLLFYYSFTTEIICNLFGKELNCELVQNVLKTPRISVEVSKYINSKVSKRTPQWEFLF